MPSISTPASSGDPSPLRFDGTWFAAGSARRHPAALRLTELEVIVEVAEQTSAYPCAAARCSSEGEPLTVELPDGGSFVVTPGQPEARVLVERLAQGSRAVRRWEQSLLSVAVSLVGAVGLVALLVLVVLPAAARPAAFLVPEKWARLIDDQVLLILDNQLLEDSALPAQKQAAVDEELRAMVTALGLDAERYRVLVRSSEGIGANAFALPGGTLIVTDDMVELADAPHELEAVMAHEVGHVERRHGLQQVLRSSAFAVMLVLVGPDPSAIANLASGLPAVFLESGYSRDFEREADDFACASLSRLGWGTKPFAEILGSLAAAHPEADGIPTWISSHPDTGERIAAIRAADGCLPDHI
jgi:predicted Zn-dependent protease